MSNFGLAAPRSVPFQVESMLKHYKVPVLLIEFNPEKVNEWSIERYSEVDKINR